MSDDISSVLERRRYCRREFNKRVASYFKAGDIELGRVTEDILQSMEYLVLMMWHHREHPDVPEFQNAFDNLVLAAGRLKVDGLSSLIGAVVEAQRGGSALAKPLSELIDYFNMLIG
ncbi:MAG: hypothetical protein IJS15_13560 [Victivallales bacterium]|nr:hypothetical protein [Victivallales bacterium]